MDEAEQNNKSIQNPVSAQSITCPINLIFIEATPAALKVLLCEPQNPAKTKPSKSKRKQKEQETEETLQEQNSEICDFLLKRWFSIRTFSRRGPGQDVFNFYHNKKFQTLIHIILEQILKSLTTRFKINYSFGFLRRNIETEEFRSYHASHNNAQILDRALLINNRQELIQFLDSLAEEDFGKKLIRSDTK